MFPLMVGYEFAKAAPYLIISLKMLLLYILLAD
jgi:hypothetical protein